MYKKNLNVARSDDDDIYVMMQCVFVCVSGKMITSYPPEQSGGGAKRDARLACRLWPSDYYYDYDDGICRNYKVKDFSPTGAARTVSLDLARIYR